MNHMKSKFARQFKSSNKETFESRGELVVQQMCNTSTQLLGEVKNEIFSLEMKISQVMDFGKSHTTQLKVEEPASYREHLLNLKELKMALEDKKYELSILEDIHIEWLEGGADKTEETI